MHQVVLVGVHEGPSDVDNVLQDAVYVEFGDLFQSGQIAQFHLVDEVVEIS